MATKTKGWSARRRAQQACNIRRAKIWAHSTGPQSPEGKAASARNALKHGLYTEVARALSRTLKKQSALMQNSPPDIPTQPSHSEKVNFSH